MENFIEKLILRKDIVFFREVIEDFIVKSSCSEIKFEDLSSKCAGLSFPRECIISTKVLEFPREILLYIIFHEVSHQYQYKKWGKNLMYDVYVNLPIDKAVSKLLEIESIADRLAMLKLRSVIGDKNLPPYRYYGCQNLQFFRDYLTNLRRRIEGLSTIEEINSVIKTLYS